MNDMSVMNRRGVLKTGAATAAAVPVATALTGLMAKNAMAAVSGTTGEATSVAASPYGPLAPVNCLNTGLPLLQLPKGFSYRSFGWTGDPMADGQPTPSNHDGMAVVTSGTGRNGRDVLIRNHERGTGTVFQTVGNPAGVYDAVGISGGCTVMQVQNGQVVASKMAIGGTAVNCAGGPTLWGSWLTCEETTLSNTAPGGRTHGHVFEVNADPMQTVAQPILDMGRFSHEAVAIDPATGYVYETEDARNISLFYRYRPNNTARQYGALGQGGVLEAAKVVGVDKANLINLPFDGAGNPALARSSSVAKVGDSFEIEWVRVANPNQAPQRYTENQPGNPSPIIPSASNPTAPNVAGPFKQGREAGALRMSRGEGIWWDQGEQLFWIADTSFGIEPSGSRRAGRGAGSVWTYKPSRSNPDRGTLTLVFAAANFQAGNNPDNVTVSPRGGIILCEDGADLVASGQPMRLLGLTGAGDAYPLVFNNINLTAGQISGAGKVVTAGDYRSFEFAGACWNKSGRTLYVNIQTPGITFAITGPWARGGL